MNSPELRCLGKPRPFGLRIGPHQHVDDDFMVFSLILKDMT
jgi:hypothetical protein